jgi:hypothetical protein
VVTVRDNVTGLPVQANVCLTSASGVEIPQEYDDVEMATNSNGVVTYSEDIPDGTYDIVVSTKDNSQEDYYESEVEYHDVVISQSNRDLGLTLNRKTVDIPVTVTGNEYEAVAVFVSFNPEVTRNEPLEDSHFQLEGTRTHNGEEYTWVRDYKYFIIASLHNYDYRINENNILSCIVSDIADSNGDITLNNIPVMSDNNCAIFAFAINQNALVILDDEEGYSNPSFEFSPYISAGTYISFTYKDKNGNPKSDTDVIIVDMAGGVYYSEGSAYDNYMTTNENGQCSNVSMSYSNLNNSYSIEGYLFEKINGKYVYKAYGEALGEPGQSTWRNITFIEETYYDFTSYADSEGETEWGTGTVRTTGVMNNGYSQVEVISNSPEESFVGEKFYVTSNAETDGNTLYQLYSDAGTTATGIYVKISDITSE